MPLKQDAARENADADEQLVQKPRRPWMIIAGLLAVHTGLLGYSAYVHSPTLNEPGHLAAGISHWRFGRFELYRVNPPLVRMVAALPVMAAGVKTDWSNFYECPGARPMFNMGENLIAANGERSFDLFMIARWACIPFSWIGGIVCFLWARDLYGNRAGVLATTLWCFSPNILAHASLITADAPASALGLAACYTFWRWLRQPTWRLTILTGVVLGVAELTKSTLVIFYPLWPLLWILYRLPERATMKTRDWLREGAMLIVRIVIAIYIINLGYGFEGSGKPLGEFQFISNTFTGEESGAIGNRFAETWLADVPVPFPRNYILGIDIQRHDFEDYGDPSYLRGEWRDTGWWYYYLYALAIKVPLGTWVLLLLTLALRLARQRPGQSLRRTRRDELFLLAPAIVILAFVSSQTGFSEHMRYVLPIFPFFFVWIGSLGKKSCISHKILDNTPGVTIMSRASLSWGVIRPRGICGRHLITAIVGIGLFWSVGSSLWVYPHSLSYFNESIGGPENGHKHLLGSNVDWGQDLRYLKWWLEDHPEARPFGHATLGPCDPSLLGVEVQGLVLRFEGHGLDCCFKPNRGWHAISANLLMGQPCLGYSGRGRRIFFDRQKLCDFRRRRATAKIGYSVFLYEVP